MIKENYDLIKNNITSTCKKTNRKVDEVELLAVSKTKPMSDIMTLYDLGQRSFGENKVQELVEKYEGMPKDINWHMIGHLQRNKVKYIASFVNCIHSVDSVRLAETINKEAHKNSRIIDVLIEVNVASEESKFGLRIDDVVEFLDNISHLNNVNVRGLMTIPPNPKSPEENRMFFRSMYKLLVDINHEKRDNVNMNVLSMGMSKDYMIAIEEGATIIRVGSDLFGSRL